MGVEGKIGAASNISLETGASGQELWNNLVNIVGAGAALAFFAYVTWKAIQIEINAVKKK